MQTRLTIIGLLLFTLTVSCNKSLAHRDSAPEKAVGPAAAIETKSYQGIGQVKSVDPKTPSIKIDHEEIKGLMPAMQMDFRVKDKSLLNSIAAGDKIEFTVENGVGGLLITAIKKLST